MNNEFDHLKRIGTFCNKCRQIVCACKNDDDEEDDIYDAVMHYRKDHPEKEVKVPQEVDWDDTIKKFQEELIVGEMYGLSCMLIEWLKQNYKIYKK